MMYPDHHAVDHVCGRVAPCQLTQSLKRGVKHASRDLSSITPGHAPMLFRQMPPLCAGPRNPHHALNRGGYPALCGIDDHAQAAVTGPITSHFSSAAPIHLPKAASKSQF